MAVYVDKMMPCVPNARWRHDEACHLVADTLPELHEFARRLGLKRSWFQNKRMPHYDLTRSKREQALRLGASEINNKDFVALMRRHQEGVNTRDAGSNPTEPT